MHSMTDGCYRTDCAVSAPSTRVKVKANNAEKEGMGHICQQLSLGFCRCSAVPPHFYTCYLIYICKRLNLLESSTLNRSHFSEGWAARTERRLKELKEKRKL